MDPRPDLPLLETLDHFPVLRLRFSLRALEPLHLPQGTEGAMLRGAFGVMFRRQVCLPSCPAPERCPLHSDSGRPACPYRAIFAPAPPPAAGRLGKNQDAPRPFVFRPLGPAASDPPLSPPPAARSSPPAASPLPAGAEFPFGLTLLGSAVEYLPFFVLAFRALVDAGLGPRRARCRLETVAALAPPAGDHLGEPAASASGQTLVYQASTDLVAHAPQQSLGQWVRPRLDSLSLPPRVPLAPKNAPDAESKTPPVLRVRFLSPTFLTHDGAPARAPDFHHLLKRARDRLQALSCFYGPGPIAADFKELGERAERVTRLSAVGGWEEHSRRSSRTGQRHELSGFVGECVFRPPSPAVWPELLPWLAAAELTHVGRHAAFGCGAFLFQINAKAG